MCLSTRRYRYLNFLRYRQPFRYKYRNWNNPSFDRAVPLLEEGAAGVLNVLKLEEAGADEQRLDVLLVDGNVSTVGEVYQGLQGTVDKQEHRHTIIGRSHQAQTV